MSSSRIKIMFVSMLAVFAVSAVAASTASAKRVWTVEGNVLPVGKTKSLKIVKHTKAVLKAGTEEIECEDLEINAGNTIENVLVEGKGPTGRDTAINTFTKCRNINVAACEVTVAAFTTPTFLVENTKAAQEKEGVKIYDSFRPNGVKELTPAEVTAKGTAASKKIEEELHIYVKIVQKGCSAPENTTVEGNGVAAEIVPQGESKVHKLVFPCPTQISTVSLWNGLEVGLKLKAFGFAAKECISEIEVELTTGEKWGVQ